MPTFFIHYFKKISKHREVETPAGISSPAPSASSAAVRLEISKSDESTPEWCEVSS